MNPLKHVAIIMDGNGRWGLKHKNSRNLGHKEGLKTVQKIIKTSVDQKIKFLTLFVFSTENWKRPKKEVTFLFELLENFLQEKVDQLNDYIKNNSFFLKRGKIVQLKYFSGKVRSADYSEFRATYGLEHGLSDFFYSQKAHLIEKS